MGVKVDGDKVDEVLASLEPLDNVRYIGIAAGEFDLILELVAESNEELFKFLTKTLRRYTWCCGFPDIADYEGVQENLLT